MVAFRGRIGLLGLGSKRKADRIALDSYADANIQKGIQEP